MSYKIGAVSRLVGLSSKTIRYYESMGLFREPRRAGSGWLSKGHRLFEEEEVDRLHFIKEAREFDFSIEQIKQVLEHFEDGPACGCGSRQLLRQLVERKLCEIQSSISELDALRSKLEDLHMRMVSLEGRGPKELLTSPRPPLSDAVFGRLKPRKPE